MARYRQVDMSSRFLAVDLSRQVLPGSFEYALSHLIDRLSLSAFESRYRNDAVGAPAYSPAVLLKIVLLAYSKGIMHSRDIEAACRENVVFMAISGDSHPHFTTLAHFVATLSEPIADVFGQVLVVCDREGLIGRQMFAIDGVKLPSNASKSKSGTRADFQREAAKMRAQVNKILEQHRSGDESDSAAGALSKREADHLERLTREATQIEQWLEQHPHDRYGPRNKVRQSNRTDNQSAKMATDKGVIQGYTAVAAVDDKHQIIVQAQAHGVGNEQELLIPVIEGLQALLSADTVVSADAGYYSKANVQALDERDIRGCIPDPNYRRRDPRYAGQQQHKAKPDALGQAPQDHQGAAVSPSRLQSRSRPEPLHLSGRQAPVPQRASSQSERLRGGQIHRRQARLRKMSAKSPMPAPPAAHSGATSGDLPAQGHLRAQARASGRAHESAHRQRARARVDRAALRHCRTGVWQHPLQQSAQPLYAARANQNRGSVETILPGAQHREAREQRLRDMMSRPEQTA